MDILYITFILILLYITLYYFILYFINHVTISVKDKDIVRCEHDIVRKQSTYIVCKQLGNDARHCR